jgi:ribosomal protein L4
MGKAVASLSELEEVRALWKITDGVTLAVLVEAARRKDGAGPTGSTLSRALAGKSVREPLSGRQLRDIKRAIMAQRKRNRQGTGAAGR